MVRCHLQSAYAGLQKYLRQKWYFVQCVTLGKRNAFHPVYESLWCAFLLDIFWGVTNVITEQRINQLPFKQ